MKKPPKNDSNGRENVGEKLTMKQEQFCQNYARNDAMFGNATLSYADAYGYDLESADKDDAVIEKDANGNEKIIEKSTFAKMENVCASAGSQLLRNIKIQDRCRAIRADMLRDDIIDDRMYQIIQRGRDSDSGAMIREYNRIKGRIIQRVVLDEDPNGLKGLSTQELVALAEKKRLEAEAARISEK